MFSRFYLFVLFFLFSGCVKQHYFQEDALYPPDKSSRLKPTPPGYVYAVIAPQYKRSKLHEIIWGKHYRAVWATPVPVPVIDISKVQGGLTPVQLGGGQQTTSLTLTDKAGRFFTLRTLDKDPSKALPLNLRQTFVANIMRDQTSAGNPYAAFTLPPLTKAIGIFYTNPQIYYVPKTNNGLGDFSGKFGGKVVMLEEKFKGNPALIPAFSQAAAIVDSEEMLNKRFLSHQYKVDQLAFAKARLFDVLIGDWDRHEGNWNWAVYADKKTGEILYKPVPKDRDQTYYRFDDGIMPWLVSRKFLVRKLKPFKHNIQDVGGLIYNARFLDEKFLNEVTQEEWLKIAGEIKAALTDEVLQKSIALFPDTINKLEGKKTLSKLKDRVNQLPQAAQEFYNLLAEDVTIIGSDEKERFVVKRLDDNTTSVKVLALSDDEPETSRIIYYRVFKHDVTEEIKLHGLAEDDEFLLEGQVNKGIKINIIGGLGQDRVVDKSYVKGRSKKTYVFDTRLGNELELGKEAKNMTTKDVAVHAFDREGY